MKSLISNVVLASGCWALFAGIFFISVSPAELPPGTATPRWWGVFLGGAGLAIVVREFAYQLGTRFRIPQGD